jgi:exosortase
MNTTRVPPHTDWFVLYTLVLLAANASVVHALVEYASGNSTASHVVGIPFISIVLAYLDRESIFAKVNTALVSGIAIVIAGVALSVAGAAAVNDPLTALSVRIAGLVVCWIGGFVTAFGWPAARSGLFPLAFLFFMVPPPASVIDAVTSFLKSGSTQAVAALFTITGTPYHRQGFVFDLPNFAIEVADECSGIRSSIALLLTTLLAGHRFLASPWTRMVLILAILPVALLKNGIRIVSLSLLAVHVDPSFLTGQLHHEGGIVFFMLSLVALVPLFPLLRWSEARWATRSAV